MDQFWFPPFTLNHPFPWSWCHQPGCCKNTGDCLSQRRRFDCKSVKAFSDQKRWSRPTFLCNAIVSMFFSDIRVWVSTELEALPHDFNRQNWNWVKLSSIVLWVYQQQEKNRPDLGWLRVVFLTTEAAFLEVTQPNGWNVGGHRNTSGSTRLASGIKSEVCHENERYFV